MRLIGLAAHMNYEIDQTLGSRLISWGLVGISQISMPQQIGQYEQVLGDSERKVLASEGEALRDNHRRKQGTELSITQTVTTQGVHV